MRRRRLALLSALAFLIALPLAFAQQPPPAPTDVWPPPPGSEDQPQPTPAPKAPKKKAAKKAPKAAPKPPPEQPDPRLEEEPSPPDSAGRPPGRTPAPKTAARRAPAMNVLCDGPFAKNASHDQLVKAFGARNVTVQTTAAGGASSVLFPSDPKRRLEVTWRDPAGRRRPATIVVEAQSTWRARGFRIGDQLAQVEKVNGKPFRLSGFDGGATGGAARDWLGGGLDKLSGGCLLGMRFAPGPNAPGNAQAKIASGDLQSDSPDVKAVKPVVIELVVGYPE